MTGQRKTSKQDWQRARKQGRVAISFDLANALTLIGCSTILLYVAPTILELCSDLVKNSWSNAASPIAARLGVFEVEPLRELVVVVLMMIVAFALIATLSRIVQIGFLFVPQRSLPDWNRLNPFSGSQRIIESSLSAACFTLAKLAILGLAGWHFVSVNGRSLGVIGTKTVAEMSRSSIELIGGLVVTVAIGMSLVGIADFWFRRLKFEQSLQTGEGERKQNVRAISSKLDTDQ